MGRRGTQSREGEGHSVEKERDMVGSRGETQWEKERDAFWRRTGKR